MGIEDRPLPKPPVVKFAALVTTAAFAGHTRFLLSFLDSLFITIQQEYSCFRLHTKATTGRMPLTGQARLPMSLHLLWFSFFVADSPENGRRARFILGTAFFQIESALIGIAHRNVRGHHEPAHTLADTWS